MTMKPKIKELPPAAPLSHWAAEFEALASRLELQSRMALGEAKVYRRIAQGLRAKEQARFIR